MNPTENAPTVASLSVDPAKLIAQRKLQDRIFVVLGIAFTSIGLVMLAALLIQLWVDGAHRLGWAFLVNEPSRVASRAGILPAWAGSLAVMTVTACLAVPIGIAAGVYLEEYAEKNWFSNLIEICITNLAGVPSIVYGLMALGLFVYTFKLGYTVLTAGLTLGCLILPIVIVATREALRSIPIGIREAAYAMGCSKWEVMRHHLLPYSIGTTATGVIIGLSRAIGETAPLVTIGALAYVIALPASPLEVEWVNTPIAVADDKHLQIPTPAMFWSRYTVLPMQMFNWTSRPEAEFHANAAAAGLVLLIGTLAMNAIAMTIRYYARRAIKW